MEIKDMAIKVEKEIMEMENINTDFIIIYKKSLSNEALFFRTLILN